MACERRIRTGHCSHHQCQWSGTTDYECVDVVGGFCETGHGCVPECPHSYTDAQGDEVNRIFRAAFAEDFPEEFGK